jgi:ATP-dependent RNA helicase RhlE
MLDMGFIHDIKKILPMLPKQKQTMLFSATMPDDIISIVKTLLHSPLKVEVAPVSSVVDTIEQHIYYVEKPDKVATLVNLIRERSDESMLVFSRTKHGADKIARVLCKNGIYCSAIHGNKSQNARQKALSDFKSGKTKVIIATDIAARGIDIKDLSIVVNYDLPDVPETYVHRIGRTGRAGHSGVAFTFCTQEEYPMMRRIQKLTGQKIDAISVGVDKDHPVIDDTNRSDERSEQRRPNNRQGNRSNNRQDSRSNSHRDNRQDHRSDSRSGGQQHQEKRSNNRQERHYSNASKSRSNGNAHRESATSRTAR